MNITPLQIILAVGVIALVIAARRQNGAGMPTPQGVLKGALAVWAIGYPVVACSPLFATGADSAGAATTGGAVSLVVGAVLFGPWIVGLLVLGVLVWVTR